MIQAISDNHVETQVMLEHHNNGNVAIVLQTALNKNVGYLSVEQYYVGQEVIEDFPNFPEGPPIAEACLYGTIPMTAVGQVVEYSNIDAGNFSCSTLVNEGANVIIFRAKKAKNFGFDTWVLAVYLD